QGRQLHSETPTREPKFSELPSANKNPPIREDGGPNKRKRLILAIRRRRHSGRVRKPLALICIATMFDKTRATYFCRAGAGAIYLLLVRHLVRSWLEAGTEPPELGRRGHLLVQRGQKKRGEQTHSQNFAGLSTRGSDRS